MFIWVQKMILNLEGFFDVHHQTSNDGEKNHDGVDLIFAKSVRMKRFEQIILITRYHCRIVCNQPNLKFLIANESRESCVSFQVKIFT